MNNLIYCTIKYKHCKKQRDCKRWLANHDEETQVKAIYDSRIVFTDGLVCLNGGYDNFMELKNGK